MLPVIPFWVDWTAPWVVFAFALVLGSAPERLVALWRALSLGDSIFLHPHGFGAVPAVELVQDLLQLVVIAGLAIAYDRWWLLLAAMTVVLCAATDLAGLIM